MLRRSAAALLATDLVREPTRRALQQRLDTPFKTVPEYFSAAAFEQLQAIAARLVPQDTLEVDLAGGLDTWVAAGIGKGWRYDRLPPDKLLFERGIIAINAEALQRHGQDFPSLDASIQDELLGNVQQGTVSAAAWREVPPAAFFTELLAELVTIYYSHPAGRDQCGDRSFADARGWTDLGLDAGSDLPD